MDDDDVQLVAHFVNSHLFVFLLAGVTFVTRARERKKGTTFCAQHVNRVASIKFGLFFVVSLFLCVSFNVAALLAISLSLSQHMGVSRLSCAFVKKYKNNNSKKKSTECVTLSCFLSRFCFLSFLGLDLCEGNPRFARVFLLTTVSFSLDDC